jgi:hypothetical protein
MCSIKSYENHKLMDCQYFYQKFILKELFKFLTQCGTQKNIKIYSRYKNTL